MRCHRCDAFVTTDMTRCSQCGWIVDAELARDERPPDLRSLPRKEPRNDQEADSKAGKKPRGQGRPWGPLESLADAIGEKRHARKRTDQRKPATTSKAKRPKSRGQKATPSHLEPNDAEAVGGWIHVLPLLQEARCTRSISDGVDWKLKLVKTNETKSIQCWAYRLHTLLIEGPDPQFVYRAVDSPEKYTPWTSSKLPDRNTKEASDLFERLGWTVVPIDFRVQGFYGPVICRKTLVIKQKRKKK